MSQVPGGAFGYHQYYKNRIDKDTLTVGQTVDERSQQSTLASLNNEDSRYDYEQNSILAGSSRDGTHDNRSIYTDFSGTDYTFNVTKYSRSFDGCSTVISETEGTQSEQKSIGLTVDSNKNDENARSHISVLDTIDGTIESDEQSDDDVLNYRISRGEWKEVGKIMNTPQGKVMASNPHPNGFGDYPLHLILDYQINFEARAKAMEAYMAEEKKQEIKFEAREDRERRRREGEEVDTVYDSDEWTSSESEDESDDDDANANNDVDSNIERSIPPAAVVLAVLKACPSACRVQGYNSRFPLHHAIRMQHSKEVIEAIIRQYPQALNMKDNQEKIPRDYELRNKGDPDLINIIAMLDRPASCWLQNVRDEEVGNNLSNELHSLEKEVGDMMVEYEKVMKDERDLLERMAEIDRVVESYNQFRENQDMDGRVAKLQISLDTELFRVKDRLNSLIGQAELKYADDEKERKYITGFNEDVIKIYENAQDEINELKEEIANMKLSVNSK